MLEHSSRRAACEGYNPRSELMREIHFMNGLGRCCQVATRALVQHCLAPSRLHSGGFSGPRGVTVSTLDSESSDRGSNPREASFCFLCWLVGIVLCDLSQGATARRTWLAHSARGFGMLFGAPPIMLRTFRCHRRIIERGVHNEYSRHLAPWPNG